MTDIIIVPQMGESVSEAEIGEISKQVGDQLKRDEIIMELETDKVAVEIRAPNDGTLEELMVKTGDIVNVGDTIAKVSQSIKSSNDKLEEKSPVQENVKQQAVPLSDKVANEKNNSLSPAPRRIIAENNLDTSSMQGTGKDGRITKEDALKAVSQSLTNETDASQVIGSQTDKPNIERIKMSKMRQTMAKRLKSAQNTAAILTTFNDVNMGPIMALRKKYQEVFIKRHNIKLGFMSFFVKASIAVLREIPEINAEIDGNDILYKDFYNIGVAMGVDKGLFVPVLKNAQNLSLAEIEKEILRYSLLARDGKLGISDMVGGTFTISNGGTFGSMLSTPILNPPQSGILGMHRIEERPVVENGEIVVRPMMYLALSYDHRIIDGKGAVTFLVRLKQLLEDPQRMVLDI